VGQEDKESQERWGVDWDYPLATHEQLNGMLQHMEQTMVEIGFLNPDTPKQLMSRLRRLYQRAAPDQVEINIMRGMMTAMQSQIRSADKGLTPEAGQTSEPAPESDPEGDKV
jgi:tRNA (cytidine32/uridine32-2'-O)-methyltransferase